MRYKDVSAIWKPLDYLRFSLLGLRRKLARSLVRSLLNLADSMMSEVERLTESRLTLLYNSPMPAPRRRTVKARCYKSRGKKPNTKRR